MIMPHSQGLSGRHAFVTGGGRGIGAAIARGLLLHGARVTVSGRNADVLAKTVSDLCRFGQVDYAAADLAAPESIMDAFSRARSRFGPVDIMVNNAGQAQSAPFLKTDDALWQNMLAVNLTGTFHCTHAALPDMLASGWGRIVNVASTAGLAGSKYVSAYGAAKHGVIGLTRSPAAELATRGMTVNAVCPGYTDTGIVRETIANIVARTGRSEAASLAKLTVGNPQKRLAQPEEVANALTWLCLPGSDAMNGQSIAVAGGEIM
jgi:NAD(P)-dependent dehydrogenase (short-subunit alcohol dehydrogenase family)